MRVEAVPGHSTATPKDDPVKVANAAKQFEALLIGQMLKSVADASPDGWMGSGNQTGASVIELAQEQFASALSAQGGLGLTKMIVQSLTKPEVSRQPTATHVLP